MAVTLQDIALRAGVSRSTVSRALNGTGRMSEDTRHAIQQLAKEMGYIPNFLAQSLHEDKTQMIGVVITSVGDPYNWDLVEGIEQVADRAGYTIFLGTSKFDPKKEMEMILKFYQRRVDGLIVQTAHLTDFQDQRFASINVPIVLVNDETDSIQHNNVTVNSRAAAKKAVGYLFSLGHRKIGYISLPLRIYSNRRRLEGYRDAFAQYGQPLNEDYVFALPAMPDHETGYNMLARVLEAGVTAVFCYNDMIAIGLMNACREQGIRIPDDLSVVGFDNIDQAGQYHPSLTTVHQPKLEMGRAAMEMILTGETVLPNRILECDLIVRESTHPIAW